MSLRARVEQLWYGPQGQDDLLAAFLAPPSWAFRLASTLRNALYDTGAWRRVPAPVPCVSVGNLVVGGTGKTPVTRWIAEFYLRRGMKPAVISRGYGGERRGPEVVTDGEGAARLYGDEPSMLALLLPEVPVVVGRDRLAAGEKAVASCGARVLVADDAFQHRRLGRTLDIVVVDAVRFLGNARLLPCGPLREPVTALRRADVVLLTNVSAAGDGLGGKRALLRDHASGADLVEGDVVPVRWHRFGARFRDSVEPPRGRVFAFCGLANPGSFARSLKASGLDLGGWRSFPDHHPFSARELEALAGEAENAGAAAVTTAKDAVRIGDWPGRVPLFVLDAELRVVTGGERFRERLAAAAEGRAE